jgi:hypothetical protein
MARDTASVTHDDFNDALGRLRSGVTAHQSYV